MKKLLATRLKPAEIILMCLVVATFFGLFFFYWKGSSSSMALKGLQAQGEASKKQLADNQAKLAKLTQRDPASVAGVNTEYLDQYIKNNDRFSSVISGIVNSSKAKTFSLTKILLEDQSTENGYKKMLYSLNVEASFIEIGKFLEKLEDAPLLTEVASVDLNRIDVEMKRCRAQIKLYSYVRAE